MKLKNFIILTLMLLCIESKAQTTVVNVDTLNTLNIVTEENKEIPNEDNNYLQLIPLGVILLGIILIFPKLVNDDY